MKIITLLVQYSYINIKYTEFSLYLDIPWMWTWLYLYEDSYTFQALFEFLDLYSDKIPDEKGIL